MPGRVSTRAELEHPRRLTATTVVYADTLGTGASTRDDQEAEAFLTRLLEAEESVTLRLNHMADSGIQYRWFSDCFNLSLSGATHQSLHRILQITAQAQLEFFYRGLLLRGAAAHGGFYHAKRVDYGPALNKAATAEKFTVDYPRIVLFPEVVDLLTSADEATKQLIAKDLTDDQFVVNFFALLPNEGKKAARNVVEQLRQSVTSRTQKKIHWITCFYNAAARGAKQFRITDANRHRFDLRPL